MSFIQQASTVNMPQLEKSNLWSTFTNYLQAVGHKLPSYFNKTRTFVSLNLKEIIVSGETFNRLTIKPNPPKGKGGRRQSDDIVYQNNPILREVLPRGFSIFFKDEKYFTSLVGMRKFSGKSIEEEDNDDDRDNSTISHDTIFDNELVETWARTNVLEVTDTTKANGKACFVKIKRENHKTYFIFGSKNVHNIVELEMFSDFISNDENGSINQFIAKDIYATRFQIMDLLPLFNKGYTLCGELCDGQHFVEGDNTITWFALSNRQGVPMRTTDTFTILENCNIKTVESKIVFSPGDDFSELGNVFNNGKKRLDEGSVLYFRNVNTGENMCCKVKTPWYIAWRMLRQIILGNPVNYRERIIKGLEEKATYTGLSSLGSAKIARRLIDFSEWFFMKSLPTGALGPWPVQAIKGVCQNGFVIYWKMYCQEMNVSEDDYKLLDEDIGRFNKIIYQIMIPHERLQNRPSKVVFMTSLQGFGKSTLAIKSNFHRIEQDECWGDTKTCMTQLKICLSKGIDCIVSRCNINPTPYRNYLKIAEEAGADIYFVGPNNMTSPLYLAVCLAGIVCRSKNSDKVMIGRKEYPFIEAIEFTTLNWKGDGKKNKGLQIHPKMVTFDGWNFDSEMETEFESLVRSKNLNLNAIKNYVETNYDRLMSLRVPLEQLHLRFDELINGLTKDQRVELKLPLYCGLMVKDKQKLIDIVLVHCEDFVAKDKLVCEHITQSFRPKDSNSILDNYRSCICTVSGLVINQVNGTGSFKISDVKTFDGQDVPIASGIPHITAWLSNGSKSMESIKFVNSDENVEIIPLNFKLNLVSRWVY